MHCPCIEYESKAKTEWILDLLVYKKPSVRNFFGATEAKNTKEGEKIMNKIISILLVGLLGFLGCSGSDAGTSAYTVQAFGLVDGSGLSVSAYVMDQEENLSPDAMLTINDEPLNIGFFAAEDLKMDQDDNLPDAIDQTVKGVASGVYQPFYFLDFLDLNERDTVDFVARGRDGSTLYSSSAVVPEKVTLIEPSPDATFLPGQEVYIKWEGGEPSTCFQVIYLGGNGEDAHYSDTIRDQNEYTLPSGVIHQGAVIIYVSGFACPEHYDDARDRNTSRFDFNFLEIGVWWAQPQTPTRERVDLKTAREKFNECIRTCQNSTSGCLTARGCVRYTPTYRFMCIVMNRHRCLNRAMKCQQACHAEYCTLLRIRHHQTPSTEAGKHHNVRKEPLHSMDRNKSV